MARILIAVALCLAGAARAQTLNDPSLTLTTVVPYGGLSQPTTMAFIGPNDLLVTERTGAVRRVLNGALQPLPVLTLNVDTLGERGLLGIEVNTQVPPRVFLYVSEAATPGGAAVANRLYRYTWDSATATLTGQTLLLELPAFYGPHHNGGVLTMGPPGQFPGVGDGAALFAVIGEVNHTGQLQNISDGPAPDDTGVIVRVLQKRRRRAGQPVHSVLQRDHHSDLRDERQLPRGRDLQ